MPIPSSYISQQVGSQMAGFANQAQYAHNVGASTGFSPPGAMAMGMTPPSFANAEYRDPNFGSAVAGGMGSAMPAAATGLSLMGGVGMLGGMGRMLDPFSMFGSGFNIASGAGMNAGFMGGMGHLARVGSQQGLMAGARVAGAGALGGAAAVAPLAAAAYGIHEAGAQIYQGAQNLSQVGGMANQYMGPQFGAGGATRPGGAFTPNQVRDITNVIGSIASEDTFASMRELKQLMDQAGQMGMLTGITNVNQFKQQFSGLVKQVRELAEVMGTSLQEAAPLFGAMQQMGVWRPQDIMGSAVAMQAMGPGGQQAVLGAMQTGAQGAFQRGGFMSAGASLGRNNMMMVSEAVRGGIFSNQDIMNLTGGLGGVEGQQQFAQQLTGVMQNMAMTPAGRLAMAGLGEFKDGRYTGGIDQDKMQALLSGRTTIGELQREGMGRTRTRRGAASFTAQQDVLGQNMAAEGGLELTASLVDSVVQRAGLSGAGADAQQILIQQMFGTDARTANALQGLGSRLPEILDRKSARMEEALRDRMRSVDELKNKSFEGLERAIEAWWEREIARPLQSVGESIGTSVQNAFNRVNDRFMGRSPDTDRLLTMSRTDRVQALQAGSLTGMSSGQEALINRTLTQNASSALTNVSPMQQIIEGIRMDQSRPDQLMALGLTSRSAPRGRELYRQSILENLTGRSASFREGGFDVTLGGRQFRSSEIQAQEALQRRRMGSNFGLATEINVEALNNAGDNVELAMGKVKNAYREIMTDPSFAQSLRGKNTLERAQAISEKLAAHPSGVVQELSKFKRGSESDMQFAMSLAGIAQKDVRATMGVSAEEMVTGFSLGPNGAPARKEVDAAYGSLSDKLGVDESRLRGLIGNEKYGLAVSRLIAGDTSIGESPELQRLMLQGSEADIGTLGDITSALKGGVPGVARDARMLGNMRIVSARRRIMGDRQRIADADLVRIDNLTGIDSDTRGFLRHYAKQMGSGSLESSNEATELAAELGSYYAQSDTRTLNALAKGQSSIGRFVAASGRASTVGRAGQSRDAFLADLRRSVSSTAGFDVFSSLPEETRAGIDKMFSDGRFSKGDVSMAREMITEALKKIGIQEDRSSAKDRQKEMIDSMTTFVGEVRKLSDSVAVTVPALEKVAGGVRSSAGDVTNAAKDWSFGGWFGGE